jgi:hypothetical protein
MAEWLAKEKYSHKQVAYEHPAKGEDHCSECRHYLTNPVRCEHVRSPIAAEDWCKRFAEKPGESKAYEAKEHENAGDHS